MPRLIATNDVHAAIEDAVSDWVAARGYELAEALAGDLYRDVESVWSREMADFDPYAGTNGEEFPW